MCRSGAVFVICALWLALPGTVALADGMVLPLPETQISDYLVVRRHQVQVQIEDGLAVTRVEQEFYNPYGVPIAGRYLFPIPPEAILTDFAVWVDGQERAVIRQDAAETNATLHAAVTQQGDPSLLQYADWESMAFDLDLRPASSQRMTLEYQETLLPQGGLYRYRYVLSTERYSSDPLEQVSVTVDVRSSAGLSSLYSSSHQVTVGALADGGTRVHWQAEEFTPTQDFELFFAPAGEGVGCGILTGERNGEGHFLFLFSPEVGEGRTRGVPKDIVFVLDRSGSMSGEKLAQVKSALHHILGKLHAQDRFALLAFNDRVSAHSYALQPVDTDALRDARHYVDALSAEGGTNLEVALRTALEILLGAPQRGATRLVVFLSDGLPTSGLTNGEEIGSSLARVNSAAAARLHVFGVGYDVNTLLLDQLAADSRGTVTYVRPGRNLESVLTDFYGKVADPVMTDLEVEFQGMEVGDLYPPVLPDLFRGSGLLLAGRYHATKGPVSVRVRGWASGEYHEYVYHFDLDRLPNRGFVPRLWATRHVGALLDQVRTQGWSQPLEDEIRELGLSYGVVTPYTEFAIDGQATGAASTESMALYGAAALNEASGRVTVEARLQNQAYQQAAQASLAQGANLITSGQYSLAEVGSHQVDLSLLKGRQGIEGRITDEWLAENLRPDRIVEFGSEEYFGLASDPKVRPFLLGGRAVIFSHQGEVIVIRDREDESPDVDGSQVTRRAGEAPQGIMLNHAKVVALWMALPWAVRAMVLLGVPWILFWLLLGVAILGYTAKRSRI